MNITKKQQTWMAAVVAAGLLGSGAVLWTGRTAAPTPGEHAHREGDSHADKEADKSADKTADSAAAHTDEAALIRLTAAQQQAAGLTVQAAGPGTLRAVSDFSGEIRFNEDRTAHVVPRLAGVADSVSAQLGQQVRSGQVLAVIASPALSELRSELLTAQRRQEAALATHAREKQLWQDRISAEQDYLQAQTALREAGIAVDNARQKLAALGATGAAGSLNRFELRAPFAGTVVEKHLSRGESVREDASVFTLSDLGTVWAEFAVAPQDLAVVRVGQQVVVTSSAFEEQVAGTVSYVGALLGEQTRTARARVTLANPRGAWRPGLFVTVRVLGAEQSVPVAVAADALQTLGQQTVAFKVVPGGFQAVPVRTGRSDGRTVEVLEGLVAGDRIAVANAFVLKSELGKAGAAHEH
ncbi:efflux RND transporter periplasmic adaptor subunit [Pelomonas sp. APW6]|uniref:Efflux RND transporter periplasmic adaptor subunit n=1 Tax=Roseateles subflavus TaxID=3053353 RepID=A0ABT7LI67_9BURK|nr:efflux RND transporter periplasmic adaptor subunit [Pelomonas sp. APW6]MDL5032555.1 efflux RND transporter periplasmic adaptor subunit [Pelomonas sp. APW6]